MIILAAVTITLGGWVIPTVITILLLLFGGFIMIGGSHGDGGGSLVGAIMCFVLGIIAVLSWVVYFIWLSFQ
jgi:hypothetical protein